MHIRKIRIQRWRLKVGETMRDCSMMKDQRSSHLDSQDESQQQGVLQELLLAQPLNHIRKLGFKVQKSVDYERNNSREQELVRP